MNGKRCGNAAFFYFLRKNVRFGTIWNDFVRFGTIWYDGYDRMIVGRAREGSPVSVIVADVALVYDERTTDRQVG